MSSVKQRLLSAIENAPDYRLEELLIILESWDHDGSWTVPDHRMIQSKQDGNPSGIEETAYLLSIPGMRESILTGMTTPIDECDRELEW